MCCVTGYYAAMNTKGVRRAINEMDDAMSVSFLSMVALGFGIVAVILQMVGVVSNEASSIGAMLLLAIGLTAFSYKMMSKSKDRLYLEYKDELDRDKYN